MERITFVTQGIPILDDLSLEILLLVTLKITVFWNVMPSYLMGLYWHAGALWYLCVKVDD
jgi:hypothetical protein